MALYDARTKYIKDTDLFYCDGVSIGTATTWVSDTIDLGAEQVFLNKPVHIFWEFSKNFSLISNASWAAGGGCTYGAGARCFLDIDNATDGSTWTTILCVPLFNPRSAVTACSIVAAATINALNVGVGTISRYSRLALRPGTTLTNATLKAWLRMGLTK